MSEGWGLLPLGMDASDLMMLVLALFILSILVIAMFIVFPMFYALLGTILIVLGIGYGVREMMKNQESND
jgi:hypothetical protein